MQQMFSPLYFPLLVLSAPKPDPDYLTIHLHSNKSTEGEVALDIHPSQIEGPSMSPRSLSPKSAPGAIGEQIRRHEDECFTVNENGLVVIQDMLLRPDQLPPRLRMKFEDCARRGKNKHLGGEDQCFTVNERGYVLIGDMWLHPDQLPSGLREKFEECEKRGKNKVKGEDQCFTVDENGLIQIGDMWLRPEQLPAGLRMKLEDCSRRGKNKLVNRGGEDQCFTVDENGFVQIGDMWLSPDQLPPGLRRKFEDCARRGKNKVKGGETPPPSPKKNFWPDYVWRKGGHRAGDKQMTV